ncbi:uncharacterized protein LOC135167052 isoform X2 [Diachasmimorpha longicaudata]
MQFMAGVDVIENPADLNATFDSIKKLRSLVYNSTDEEKFAAWKSQLEHYLSNIHSNYDGLKALLKQPGPIVVKDWMNFARSTKVNIPSNMSAFIEELFNRGRQPGNSSSFIMELARLSNELQEKHCTEAFAMNGFINQLANLALITQMKAVVPLVYSAVLRHRNNPVRRTKLERIMSDYKTEYLKILRPIEQAMTAAPDNLVSCNSPDSVLTPGEDYFELERLEQLTISQFNSSKSKSCTKAKNNHLLRFDSQQDTCNGSLYNCEYSAWLDVCRLENNTKRYGWIRSEYGNYGKNLEECRDGKITRYEQNINSSIGYCLCQCRETVNWISVTPVMTNISANMVITGLRFVREKGVLYLQVKQGKLLPNEKIDAASQEWIPLPKNPNLKPLNSGNGELYLRELIADVNDIPVGVSFVARDDHFYLQTTVVGYTFYGSLSSHKPRKLYPTQPVQYDTSVAFEMSDREDNAGQSVLPFINAKAAEADPPIPLGGLSIAYDGRRRLISPKLIALPYKKVFKQTIY